MGWIAGWHGKTGEGYSYHAGLPDEHSDVVEISAVAGQAAGLQLSERGGRPGNCFILLCDHENGVSGGQDGIGHGNEIVPALSNHRNLDTAEHPRRQFVESLSGMALADRNFAHV